MSENDVLVPNSYYSAFKSSATLYSQFESIKIEEPDEDLPDLFGEP